MTHHWYRQAFARACALTSLCGMTLSAPLAAQTPMPAMQWAVKIAPGECMLDATGIATPIPVALSLRTIVGSDAYRFAIVGKDVPKLAPSLSPVTIQFRQADRSFQEQAIGAHLGTLGEAIVVQGMDPTLLDAMAHSTSVSVTAKSATLGPFVLPRAKGAIDALLGCERDQLVEWGADPAQFQAGGKRPVALRSRDNWLTNAQLLTLPMESDELHATFQVGIAPDGKVDGCKRIDPNAKGGAEKAACDMLKGQTLFIPASDAAGKPVRGAATFEVALIRRRN